jgi:hypothetical protein
MNPNYLLKDELVYELTIRGIQEEADSNKLRKLFRSAITRRLPVDVRYLQAFESHELYEQVVSKIRELQVLLTRPHADLSSLATRVANKVAHLRGRLCYLEDVERHRSSFFHPEVRF